MRDARAQMSIQVDLYMYYIAGLKNRTKVYSADQSVATAMYYYEGDHHTSRESLFRAVTYYTIFPRACAEF